MAALPRNWREFSGKKRNGEFAGATNFEISDTYGRLSQELMCEGETDRDKCLEDR